MSTAPARRSLRQWTPLPQPTPFFQGFRSFSRPRPRTWPRLRTCACPMHLFAHADAHACAHVARVDAPCAHAHMRLPTPMRVLAHLRRRTRRRTLTRTRAHAPCMCPCLCPRICARCAHRRTMRTCAHAPAYAHAWARASASVHGHAHPCARSVHFPMLMPTHVHTSRVERPPRACMRACAYALAYAHARVPHASAHACVHVVTRLGAPCENICGPHVMKKMH